QTLQFVARRLLADPIGLLISMRSEPDAVLADAGLPTLDLAGLNLAAATTLITASGGGPVSTELAGKLYQSTSGNPLALVELSRDLDRIGRLPPELPLPVTETVARAFGRRIAALSDTARRALLVAVVADGDLGVTAHALGAEVERLADAESAGLLRLGLRQAEFRHPLVRSAIYASAEPNARREAHRAVAAA